MARKPFTEEQLKELRMNPYTHSVTPKVIKFTVEFKEFLYNELKKEGMTTRKVFEAAGYNTEWFTKQTLDSVRRTVRKEAESPTGFKPPTGLSSRKKTELFQQKDLSKQKTDQSIKELQERIVNLEQQLEFLKKISHTIDYHNKKDTT